ncbi:MAG: hypothetical protein KDE45_03610 [Caldilineaceae bacterium]|nr:hypothetical protein [Caldilineaceae bacterium]
MIHDLHLVRLCWRYRKSVFPGFAVRCRKSLRDLPVTIVIVCKHADHALRNGQFPENLKIGLILAADGLSGTAAFMNKKGS